ncbi:MAG TPA: matrixin family metalloprotease [Gemmataceae bacterium]|nr:matrixin family metalloprotease [Gemmataceae bacterium]
MRRKTRPCVQELEDRCVPVTWGNPWPDATHLTLSFAPDGTKLGSQTSELFSKLDATMPRDAWQMEILRAFQTWAAQSNINVGLVSDGGQAFGTPGSVQSDTRFGDVRLSGVPLADDALATTIPFEVAGGTLAGDVRVNTDSPFTPGGVGGFDLNTVMMQEAGHVFGLDNSPDPNSVMYEIYSGKRAGLSAGDVAALQALYGARKPDALEGGGGNETRSTATRLNLLSNSDGSLSFSAAGDITTAAERDVYSFTTPLSAGTLVVRLRTSGLSLLTSQVSVFDAWSNRLKTAAAVDPRSGDLLLLLNGLRILSTYNVQVEGAGTEVFRVGSYQLDVQWLPLVNGLVGTATGLVGSATGTVTQLLANNDLHTNDGINAAGLSLQM